MTTQFGEELRHWRKRRQLSQSALAEQATCSPRHLSCLETGKAAPSRTMVLTLAEYLGVPLEKTNRLLTLAGFAPVYRSNGLSGADAEPVRQAFRFLLRRHHPYPAVVVDPGWWVHLSNDAYANFVIRLRGQVTTPQSAEVIHDEPPIAGSNALLPLFDASGLRSRVRNFDQFAGSVLQHLRRAARDEPAAAATLEHLKNETVPSFEPPAELPVVVPLQIAMDDFSLNLFSTMTMLGTSTDSVLTTLRIETFFPADEKSDAFFRQGV